MRFVEVEWKDISSENAWIDADDLDKAIAKDWESRFFTVGWVYEETDEYIVLLPTASFEKKGKLERASYEIIPKGCIIKIKAFPGKARG